jgi:anaerobic dimethyl sulfoxide reductase subunit A
MFGCRTNSWSVPSYQATTFSSRMTFGTIEDGNEDDAFAHSKLIIMWGWNPAYTFHGGNTFYYMRMAKQRGCKFVAGRPAVHRLGRQPTTPGGSRSSPTPTRP